jgi:hypothetical protein
LEERKENKNSKINKIYRTCAKKERDRINKQRNLERKQTCMNYERKRKTEKERKTNKIKTDLSVDLQPLWISAAFSVS